jgi:hypothetical protein
MVATKHPTQFSVNENQTLQFAVGCSFVLAMLCAGIAITELLRKLAKEREQVERLRRMNSRNYHHRITMQRAIDAYCHTDQHDINATRQAYMAMSLACKESKASNE